MFFVSLRLLESEEVAQLSFLLLYYRFLFSAVAERGGTCSKVLKPQYFRADLHYNQKFVPESKQSSYFVLQDLVNYKCSSEFEKYLCDTSVPPCEPDDMSVYVHCRDICEQVSQYGALMQREVFFIFAPAGFWPRRPKPDEAP